MSLGKGLSSLIPPRQSLANLRSQMVAADDSIRLLEISPSQITTNPYQPRRSFNEWELDDLVKSIKEHGILQPLVVTQTGDKFELISGERRLKAAKLANLKTVPVVIRKATDLEKLELALIENIQRADLNPIEKAEGYQKLIHEFGLTQEQAAKKIGIPRPSFANTLRLLGLPAEVIKVLAEERISEGHAKVLLSLSGPMEQVKLMRLILQNKLSVRESEQYLQGNKLPVKLKSNKRNWRDPQVLAWEETLQEKLHTPVKISKKGEMGYIKIDFFSSEELLGLVKKIT